MRKWGQCVTFTRPMVDELAGILEDGNSCADKRHVALRFRHQHENRLHVREIASQYSQPIPKVHTTTEEGNAKRPLDCLAKYLTNQVVVPFDNVRQVHPYDVLLYMLEP